MTPRSWTARAFALSVLGASLAGCVGDHGSYGGPGYGGGYGSRPYAYSGSGWSGRGYGGGGGYGSYGHRGGGYGGGWRGGWRGG
jgi:hypothetical protein